MRWLLSDEIGAYKRTAILLGFLSCCLTGCFRTVRFYDGPARPASQVARIKDSPSVAVTEVDGKGFMWLGPDIVEVEPGLRRITIAYIGPYTSADPYTARFMAEAGHLYQLEATIIQTTADRNRGRWRPYLVDVKENKALPLERAVP